MAPYKRDAVSRADVCQAQPTDGEFGIFLRWSIWRRQSSVTAQGSGQSVGTLHIVFKGMKLTDWFYAQLCLNSLGAAFVFWQWQVHLHCFFVDTLGQGTSARFEHFFPRYFFRKCATSIETWIPATCTVTVFWLQTFYDWWLLEVQAYSTCSVIGLIWLNPDVTWPGINPLFNKIEVFFLL